MIYNAGVSLTFPAGVSVTLSATADANSTWGGFNGSGDTGPQGITVTMSANQTVTAKFDKIQVTNNPPTISWTAQPGTVSTGASYTIAASATDDGNLSSITVLRNGAPVSLTTNAIAFQSGAVSYTTSDTNGGSADATVTYTAYATDLEGARSGTISQTVTIKPKPAGVDAAISASVTTSNAPGAATLTWSTSGPVTDVSVVGQNLFSAALWATQEVTGLAAGDYTYTITANGSGGDTVTRSTSFRIAPAQNVTADISASPSSVLEGGSATIGWNSANATSVAVTGAGGFSSTLPASSLSLSNLAAGTYSYTITAQGQGGPVSKTATLTVNRSNGVSSWITVSPSTGIAPTMPTVSWGSTNATSVVVNTPVGGTLSTDLSGAQAYSIPTPGDYTFSITASGPGGTDSHSVVFKATNSNGQVPPPQRQLSMHITVPGWPTFNSISNRVSGQGGTVNITGDTDIAGPVRIEIYRKDPHRYLSTEVIGEDDNGDPIYGEVPRVDYPTKTLIETRDVYAGRGTGLVWGPFTYPPSTSTTDVTEYYFHAYGTDDRGGGSYTEFYVDPIPTQSVALTPAQIGGLPGQTITLTASGGHNGYVWSGATTTSGGTATFTLPTGAKLGDTYTVTAYSPASALWQQSNYATAIISCGQLISDSAVKMSLLVDPTSKPSSGGPVKVQASVLVGAGVTAYGSLYVQGPAYQAAYRASDGSQYVPYGRAPNAAPTVDWSFTLPANASLTPQTYTVYLNVSSNSFSPARILQQTVEVAPMSADSPPVVTVSKPYDYYWYGGVNWFAPTPSDFSVFSPGVDATVSAMVMFSDRIWRPLLLQVANGYGSYSSFSMAPAMAWTNATTKGRVKFGDEFCGSGTIVGPYTIRVTATSAHGTTFAEAQGTIYGMAHANVYFDAPAWSTASDPDTGDPYDLTPWDCGWSIAADAVPTGQPMALQMSQGSQYRFVRWKNSAGTTLSFLPNPSITANWIGENTFYAELVLDYTPKTPVTFVASPQSFVYDGQPHSPTIVPSTAGVPYTATGTATATAVGTYTLTVSADPRTNFSGSQSLTWTITPKPVTFQFANLTATYDGSAKVATVTPSDPAAPFTVTYAGTNGTMYGPTSAAPTNAGVYSVTATASGTFSGTGSATMVISKATPFIAWSAPAAITYGTALSGTQLNATSFVPGSFDYTPGAGAVLPAGTQSLTVNFTPADAVNYTAATRSVTLTVEKATPTITWRPPSPLTYGTALGVLQLNAGASTPGTFTYTPAAGAVLAAGAQSLRATFAPTDSANYTSATAAVTLTVDKAPLVVTANDQSRTYGGSNPALTFTLSGFVNGDTSAALTPPTASTTATTASPVGTYPITLSGGSAANYTFTYRSGSLTITPARLTIAADDQTRAFGDPNPPLTYRVTGYVNGDSALVISGAPALATSATAASDVGTYPITVTQGSASAVNYQFDFRNAQLLVKARPVTFIFSNLAQVYDGTVKTAVVQPSEPGVAYSAVLNGGPDAGSYVVSATASHGWSGAGSATLVITPAPQTVTLTPAVQSAYVGQAVTFTATGGHNAYTWTGGASGVTDTASATFSTPGTYTVSVSNVASRNYLAAPVVTATVTVLGARAVTEFTPLESNYSVSDPASPLNGQTYRRVWRDGGWAAYLARSGVRFNVKAEAWPSVKTLEIQAKPPGGAWAQLATHAPATANTAIDHTFSVMLGETAPGQPLVPLSFLQGTAQTGAWAFRARVQDADGTWSAFTEEVSIDVVLPVTTRTLSGQTVPPAGPMGAWFTASPVQTFSFPLWIP